MRKQENKIEMIRKNKYEENDMENSSKKLWREVTLHSEDRDHTKLTCFEALRAKNLNCQNFIISDRISKKSVSYFRTEQNRPNMSVYPSLEDMKVDHMMQVQSFNLEKSQTE